MNIFLQNKKQLLKIVSTESQTYYYLKNSWQFLDFSIINARLSYPFKQALFQPETIKKKCKTSAT